MKTRIRKFPGNFLLMWLLAFAGWTGCKNQVDGPVPRFGQVEPEVVCNQLETWVEINGEDFSHSAVDALTDEQKMALPKITLYLGADIDGSDFGSAQEFVLNPDPTDVANTRVRWSSSKKLSFLVDEALGLPRGIYDVLIQNPTGGKDMKIRAFTAVPPPVLHSALPTPVCTEQYVNEIELTGEWFLKIGEALPTVHINGVDFTPTAMENCEEVVTPRGDVQRCDTIRITVGINEVGVGAHAVSVTNPAPANCTSSDPVILHILPRPAVVDAVEHPLCVAQGDRHLTVHGSDFLIIGGVDPTVTIGGVAATVVDVYGCDTIEGLSTTMTCTTIDVVVSQESLEAGVHAVVVHNPESAQCVSTDVITITVVPPPVLVSLVPQPVCTAQDENILLLSGTGFLQIGNAVPVLTIGGVEISSFELGSCTAVPGTDDTVTCTEMLITLPAGAIEPGLHDVVVENPLPAGCTSEVEGMTPEDSVRLAVVPDPVLDGIEPNPICLAQQAMSMTLTGSGFLRIGSDVPVVTIGPVQLVDVVLSEDTCVPVPGVDDVVSCTELTGMLPQDSLAEDGGPYPVTITNPAPAGCHSTQTVLLEVAPPPDVTSITPTDLCTGGGFFTVVGTGLQGIYAYLVDSDGGEVHPSSITVNAEGTEALIAFGAGLRPAVYDLHVTGQGGCVDTLAAAVTVTIGPVIFYMDPEVTYSGISVQATIYGSGITSAPASVSIAPSGGGTEIPLTNVSWDPLRPNRILATIPAGLEAGAYDVFVWGVSGCDAFLAEGLTVVSEARIALLSPAMDPRFGHAYTNVAVNILAKADADLLADEVNFLPTPRAYLSSVDLGTAEPLRAVVFDASNQLSAIVPPLPPGMYDLVVINPGLPATVGYQANAYEAVEVAPPVIDDVAPTKIETSGGQIIFVNGNHFNSPSVTLECSDGSTPAAVIDFAESTYTRLRVTVNGGMTQHGSACVVRVTNTDNNTYDEWSAISVTNPAGNISPFIPGTTTLEMGRRAPAVTFGRATRKSRFLYTLGGDGGAFGSVMDTIELAPLGRFGDIGQWRFANNHLPEGRSMAMAKQLGRFIHVIGGMDATGVPRSEVYRSKILDPLDVPQIVNVDLRFAPSGAGLETGSWTYMVSAVFASTDGDNPGGETLPSEAVTIFAPDVPDGVEIELTWDTMVGTDGTPAVEYRVYRTLHVNEGAADVRLMAVVPGTAAATHSYTDDNPLVFEDDTKSPLRIGSLGEWHIITLLNTPRAAYGFIDVTEYAAAGVEQGSLGCTNYWYVFGGATDAANQSLTYEVFDISSGVLGAPVEFTATGTISARRELSVWVATQGNSTAQNLNTCEFYFYVGPGASGTFATPTSQSTVRVTKYVGAAGGQLPDFAQAMSAPAPVDYMGYAAFWSGSFVYAMGGRQGGIISNTVNDGNWSLGAEPMLQNMNNAANNLSLPRYLYGYTRVGAFVYLVGGVTTGNAITDSSEFNVR